MRTGTAALYIQVWPARHSSSQSTLWAVTRAVEISTTKQPMWDNQLHVREKPGSQQHDGARSRVLLMGRRVTSRKSRVAQLPTLGFTRSARSGATVIGPSGDSAPKKHVGLGLYRCNAVRFQSRNHDVSQKDIYTHYKSACN